MKTPHRHKKSIIWKPFTQMQKTLDCPSVTRAKGSVLYLQDGRRLIDAISSWWVISLGHCEPSIVKAVRRQAQNLDQVLFANFSHQPAIQLAEQLSSLLPKSLNHLFFSDDGSTAVESALKMAVQSFKQKNSKKSSQRNMFIAFTHSYHGDTIGAMSVSGSSLFTKPYRKLLFPVLKARQGTKSFHSPARYVQDFEKKIKQHHKHCAGVIIEPLIQGAGGMIMWPKEALQEICYLTKKYKLYLIFDEVMTGFGRTGTLFAFQQLNIVPDILCLSKGLTGGFLPLALTITNKEIYSSFLSPKKEDLFFHGHSFTGNPVSCAAATAHIKTLKKQSIKKHWGRINQFHTKKAQALKGHKKYIDVRVCGTVAALEFRLRPQYLGYNSYFADHFTKCAMKHGVFLRPIGNIVYILPPYLISNKELEQVWSVATHNHPELHKFY